MADQEMEFRFLYRVRSLLHSARNASTGFTDAAFLAGIKLAISAETPSTTATPDNVDRSHEVTPNSIPCITLAIITAKNSPARIPVHINHAASLRINL